MKKHKMLKAVMMVIVALSLFFTVTAVAAEYTDDGMTFEIVTTKQSYDVNEEVQIILLAKNYNEHMNLSKITWNATIPQDEELTFLSGELSGQQTVEVGERAAITLRMMKVVEQEPPVVQPPVEEPQPGEQPEQPEEESDAGATVLVIVLIVIALAAIAVVVFLILKRRGIISCFVILMVLSLLLPCMPIMDVSASGLNLGDVIPGPSGELNATVKFMVDGKEYEATATITYEMEKQTQTVVEAMRSDMSDYEWATYAEPTITPTIGQHPRVLFTEGDIPKIIENLESEECAEMATEFFTNLSISFNGTFASLSEQDKADGLSNYNSKNLASIRAKALYYALYKNSDDPEKSSMALYYGKTAVRAIQRAMDTIVFASGYDIYTRGDFQCTAAEVYDWCYDLLTYEDKQNIVAQVQKIGAGSESGWPIVVDNAVTSHFAGSLIQKNWLEVAIAVYDEYPNFYDFIGGVYFEVFLAPRNVWYVSGTHHQGASYGVAGRADCDMQAQELIYRMTGGANDYDGDGKADGIYALDAAAGTIGYQVLYNLRPDGQQFREGDTWEENQTDKNVMWDAAAIGLERLSNIYQNPHYRRAAHELSGGLKFRLSNALETLVTHDPTVSSSSYYNLPYTRYFQEPSASMIARTGWDMGIASNDVLVKMQLSPVYLNNHQHRDAGSFQIYYKGILASESGYYVLYGTQHDTYYTKTSTAHNTLAITSINNRYGQQNTAAVPTWGTEGKQDLVNVVLGYEYGPNVNKPEYSYLAGDIAGSYDANVQEAVRSMIFLNLGLDGNTEYPGAFIVFDQIKTNEIGSKKSFLLHMQSEPTINGNVITITNNAGDYNGKLTDQVLYVGTADKADSKYTIEAIGGPGKQFVVGNYNYAHSDSITADLSQEQGWGRVEISTTTTTTNQTDYLLNVMYVSNADGSTEVVPATLIYDGKGVLMGAQLMNHVAMFNMDGNNRISKETTFTIPASEGYSTFKVNVAGLKAGTWTVYVNGKSVGTQVASEEGGMIYFEAAAGTVKLVYTSEESNKTFDQTPNTDEEPIGLMINDFYYYTDAHPIKSGEDYLVPVSVVFEALNGKGSWNGDKTQYTAEFDSKIYVFTESSVTVDGESVSFNEIRLSGGDLLLDMTTLKQLIAGEGDIYYDPYIEDIRVNVAVVTAVPGLSLDVLNKFPNAVQVDAVIDKGYSTLPMANALDNDPTTRWTSQESANKKSEGIFDFGKVIPLTEMMLKFYTESGLYSDFVFDVLTSTDGTQWDVAVENTRSGEVAYETMDTTWVNVVLNCDARYVKIVGHGRFTYGVSGKPTASTNNTWTSISEVVFLQKAIIDPDNAELVGNRLQAEAECFHQNAGVTTLKNGNALSMEEVQLALGSKNNPGSAASAKPQLYASFVPKVDAAHYIWVRVNSDKVTSGDTLWVHIEGLTGDKYYAENVKLGHTDSNGYRWIKLGQYEEHTALTQLKAGKKYKISVISGCEGLIVDCFMIATDPAYVPYDPCYSQMTDTKGNIEVDAKNAIFEHSVATPAGTGAMLQKVSADGSVSKNYLDYVLANKNLPGDITLDIRTDTSGMFTAYATVKVSSLSNDRFFYAVSANDSDYKYTLMDLSETVENLKSGEFVTVKLGSVEAQASESVFVRIKACSEGVTFGKFTTTCVLPTGVYETTGGQLTMEAEDATLSKPGEENVIVSGNQFFTGETVKVLTSSNASGGQAVQFTQTYSAWNKMITYTNEPNAHISFRVMPDETAEYYIWIKVYAPKDSAIYAYIDGGIDNYYWRQPLTNETYSVNEEDYIWVCLSEEWRSVSKITSERHYQWTARRIYTINLRGNTGNVRVDQIFITNDPNEAPHNHLFSDKWTANATHHWNAVTCGCEDVTPRYYAEHFYEDHTDKDCNTCGYTNPDYAPHDYEDGYCIICGKLEPFKLSGGKGTIEAEDMMLAPDGTENHISSRPNNVVKVVQIADGKAVQFTQTNTGWNQMLTVGTTPIAHLSAYVTPDKTGQYYIWVKVYAPENSSHTSIYAYIDGGEDTYYWRQPLNLESYSSQESDYYWVQLCAEHRMPPTKTADHVYNWTAGQTYTLRFRGFNAGVRVDKIYITNNPNDIPHEHIYSGDWDKDATHHWHSAVCGHNDLITDKTAHSYGTEWLKDSNYHWNECICGAQANKAEHTFVDGKCSGCGTPKPFQTSGGKLTVQAENTILAKPGTENFISGYTGSLVTLDQNGQVVRFDRTHTAWNQYVSAGDTPIPHISLYVTPDVSGEYYIWIKVYAPKNSSTTSVYAYIDGGEDTYYWRQPLTTEDLYSETATDYIWVRLDSECRNGVDVTKERTYNWTAGETYAIRLRGFTQLVRIDEFYITSDPNDPYPKNHEHTYAEGWTTDDTHHWHAATCQHTDKVSDKAAHSYEDDLDATCNDCGYVREIHYHSFSTVWSKDQDYHWQVCACGAEQNKEKHSFVSQICTVCGMKDNAKTVNGSALIEAEDGLLQEAGKENYLTGGTWDTVPPFAVTDNAAASGGQTITAMQGSTAWYGLQTYSKNHNGEDPSAHVSYTVEADQTGQYYIWIKVYAPNNWGSGSGDAVYAFIGDDNGTDTYYWRQPVKDTDGTYSDGASDFYWVRVYQQFNGTSQNGKDKVYNWTAGETYTLRFRVYSANVQIDQIFVTTSNQTPDAILGA